MKLLASKFDAYISSAKTYCLPISKYGFVSEYGTKAYCGCVMGHDLPQPAYSRLKPSILQSVPGILPVPSHAANIEPELWSMSQEVSNGTGRSFMRSPYES